METKCGPIEKKKFVCLVSATRLEVSIENRVDSRRVGSSLLVALNGHAEANKTCMSKATEALPHIAGLVIKRSRARPSCSGDGR